MSKHSVQFSLVDYSYDNNRLAFATIELLTQCPLNCIHCYLPEHSNQGLNTVQVKGIIDDIRNSGVFKIVFTGGEIFLREDIFEIIEFARSKFMRVDLMSTAILLDDEKIKRLSDLCIHDFSTSVYSMDPNIHDLITTVPGSLEKTLDNLIKLKTSGINVEVKTPIMKVNRKSVANIQAFCKENGFKHEVTPAITAKNDGDLSPLLLRLEQNEILEVVRDSGAVISKIDYDPEHVLCRWMYNSVYIDSCGDVFPCNSFLYKTGNILENSLSDIWIESKELEKLKGMRMKDLEACSQCEEYAFCNKCPGLAYHELGDLCGCTELSKSIAKSRRQLYMNAN